MLRGKVLVAVLSALALSWGSAARAQLEEAFSGEAPARSEMPSNERSVPATEPAQPPKEKMARIWANEPPLVRLAREKFGAEFTESDAKFFAAVAAVEWADFRESADAKYDATEPASWTKSPVIKANRISWLCSDPNAMKLVSSRGIWLRGVNIEGKVDLYRGDVPFSLTFYDCLLDDGMNLSFSKLQELDIRNCCTAAINARGARIAENVYMLNTAVFGGLNFVDAQIGGDFDLSGGLAFHGTSAEDVGKPGLAITLYDAKVGGDIKLAEKFRALGQVQLIGAQIGRGLSCNDSQFAGSGQVAIDASRTIIAGNVGFNSDFHAEGGVALRRAQIAGDLNCDGGRFVASGVNAIDADRVSVGGQVNMGDGFHAEGEVRLINAMIGGDIDCDNGHFIHPDGDALSLDTTVISSCLRIGTDPTGATDKDTSLPGTFVARGTVRLCGTRINQELIAGGSRFETPTRDAILASNLRVGSRAKLSGIQVKGTLNLMSAEIEHELDLSGSQFDGKEVPYHVAISANGMQVRGRVYCNRIETPERTWPFRVDGLAQFQFATINMQWELWGAELVNPGAYALDASDCHVGGYVNLDHVAIDGTASFSRAKIDGMWILDNVKNPEHLRLDMRFAHIWVIKDERLEDWPPAGQLQLEGLVYDHFDDDSPLSVEDRLAWLRRQYAPAKHHTDVRRRALDTVQSTRSEPKFLDEIDIFTPAPSSERAQATRDKRDQIARVVPVQYQTQAPSVQMSQPAPTTMPAPSMSPVPTMPTPMPEPPPVEPEMFGDEDGTKLDEKEGDPTPTTDEMEVAESTVAAATEQSASPTPPDPAGRRYITQPYTQLAAVYRAIGQDEQASAVLVARAERLGELSPVFSAQGLWYRYFGRLIGYGYEPFRAIKIGVGIVLFGALVFGLGAHRNLMAETKLAESVISQEGEKQLVSPTYPRFNPLVYSLDVFLPFADLHQRCYWIPGDNPSQPRTSRNCLMHLGPLRLKWSAVLRTYLWFQTLAGWTLCTLLAAAVTGIVQS